MFPHSHEYISLISCSTQSITVLWHLQVFQIDLSETWLATACLKARHTFDLPAGDACSHLGLVESQYMKHTSSSSATCSAALSTWAADSSCVIWWINASASLQLWPLLFFRAYRLRASVCGLNGLWYLFMLLIIVDRWDTVKSFCLCVYLYVVTRLGLLRLIAVIK